VGDEIYYVFVGRMRFEHPCNVQFLTDAHSSDDLQR